jgi:hypothetical protein
MLEHRCCSVVATFSREVAAMKIPFMTPRTRLSDEEIRAAMDQLRKLRLEVAAAEIEAELSRASSNVRVLHSRKA